MFSPAFSLSSLRLVCLRNFPVCCRFGRIMSICDPSDQLFFAQDSVPNAMDWRVVGIGMGRKPLLKGVPPKGGE